MLFVSAGSAVLPVSGGAFAQIARHDTVKQVNVRVIAVEKIGKDTPDKSKPRAKYSIGKSSLVKKQRQLDKPGLLEESLIKRTAKSVKPSGTKIGKSQITQGGLNETRNPGQKIADLQAPQSKQYQRRDNKSAIKTETTLQPPRSVDNNLTQHEEKTSDQTKPKLREIKPASRTVDTSRYEAQEENLTNKTVSVKNAHSSNKAENVHKSSSIYIRLGITLILAGIAGAILIGKLSFLISMSGIVFTLIGLLIKS